MKVFHFSIFLVFTLYLNGQDFLPKSQGQVINHNYYSVSYNELHEQANWVHYKLNPYMLTGTTKRIDNFRIDPSVKSESASPYDYKGSGYDRGHLAPAGDMKISFTSMSESFFMSNISPQNPSFNRGGWKRLESLVRAWAKKNEVFITTAGVLNNNYFKKIGFNSVSVPREFYKLIYMPSENKMIAFLMPNQKINGQLKDYVVSVDTVEELTGIDFYSELDDVLEKKLEAEINPSKWNFNLTFQSKTYSSSVSSQCKGMAKSTRNRCRNNTTNSNGYCYLHKDQSPDYKKPQSSNYVGRCNATTKKGTRCKRNATTGFRFCWQHK